MTLLSGRDARSESCDGHAIASEIAELLDPSGAEDGDRGILKELRVVSIGVLDELDEMLEDIGGW